MMLNDDKNMNSEKIVFNNRTNSIKPGISYHKKELYISMVIYNVAIVLCKIIRRSLKIYDITIPLLILCLAMYDLPFFRKQRWLYILLSVLLIALNIWVFTSKTVLFDGV